MSKNHIVEFPYENLVGATCLKVIEACPYRTVVPGIMLKGEFIGVCQGRLMGENRTPRSLMKDFIVL